MTEIQASSCEQTRSRLLDAAREIFSQCGFQGATVREICRRADANVAAVNYHFGSKDGLLAEALNFTALKALQSTNVAAHACPEIRLRLFIRDFMLLLLDDDNASQQCRIMARELAGPSPALDKIVREAIGPLHEFLGKLVGEIVGYPMNEIEQRRYAYSLFGQCLFYRHSHPVLLRLHPELRYDRDEIEAIANHISEFSLAALRAKKSDFKS
jgi:AcrR family transcriptional regulator